MNFSLTRAQHKWSGHNWLSIESSIPLQNAFRITLCITFSSCLFLNRCMSSHGILYLLWVYDSVDKKTKWPTLILLVLIHSAYHQCDNYFHSSTSIVPRTRDIVVPYKENDQENHERSVWPQERTVHNIKEPMWHGLFNSLRISDHSCPADIATIRVCDMVCDIRIQIRHLAYWILKMFEEKEFQIC